MVKVESFDHLLGQIEMVKAKRRGYLTNFYHDRKKVTLWVNRNILYFLSYEDTLFVLKQNNDFFSLFYCTTDFEQLRKTLPLLKAELAETILVIDIIGNNTSLSKTEQVFLDNSYHNYASLFRMSRAISEKEIDTYSNICFATPEDALTIESLLNEYFDPLCEQIPFIEEIDEWIELKHILVCKEDEFIAGFLIFDLIGITSYLRYWFTHPLHRDKHIGSQLLRRFFFESNSAKRQLFWVLDDNENAIKRYRHYGFESENMYDNVLVSQQINKIK